MKQERTSLSAESYLNNFENWKSEKKKKKKKGQSLSFNSENCKEPQADQRQSFKLVSHT